MGIVLSALRVMTKYDWKVIGLITVLTASVLVLLGILALVFGVTVYPWWFLPAGWWIGAMMVWGYEKYTGHGAIGNNPNVA